jgi:hypothetical protein
MRAPGYAAAAKSLVLGAVADGSRSTQGGSASSSAIKRWQPWRQAFVLGAGDQQYLNARRHICPLIGSMLRQDGEFFLNEGAQIARTLQSRGSLPGA